MTTVRLFSAKITNEFGGEFPQAFVGVRAVVKSAKEVYENEKLDGEYEVDALVDAISYKVSYWYSPSTKEAGFPSCPLFTYVDGKFEDTFKVDLDHPETREILSGTRDQRAMMFDAIQADIIRRFK